MGHLGQMQREEIAQGFLADMSVRDIAETTTVSKSTVARALKSDKELKRMIQESLGTITDVLPKAVLNIKHVVDKFQDDLPKEYGKAELQMREFGYDASKKVLGIMGFGDAHAQAPVIQQFFIQNNNNQYFSPLTERALNQAMTCLDAEIVDSESEGPEKP